MVIYSIDVSHQRRAAEGGKSVTGNKVAVRVVGHVLTATVAEGIDGAIVSNDRLSEAQRLGARLATLVGRLMAHALVEAVVANMED